MTFGNPHPLANPLNKHQFSKNYFSISKPSDPCMLTVPEAKPYDANASSLEVPCQDVPYGDGARPICGFIGNTTLFRLHDGSVVDMKSHKVVFDPAKRWKAAGYWNDPNATTAKSSHGEWGRTETIDELLNKVDNGDGTFNDPNLSLESIKYWKMANAESKKLQQNMTDEQKQLLNDLHSGKIFPLSKLVDEK